MRDYIVFIIAVIYHRLEDYHALPGIFCPTNTPDQLLGFPAEHTPTDHFYPTGFIIYDVQNSRSKDFSKQIPSL